MAISFAARMEILRAAFRFTEVASLNASPWLAKSDSRGCDHGRLYQLNSKQIKGVIPARAKNAMGETDWPQSNQLASLTQKWTLTRSFLGIAAVVTAINLAHTTQAELYSGWLSNQEVGC